MGEPEPEPYHCGLARTGSGACHKCSKHALDISLMSAVKIVKYVTKLSLNNSVFISTKSRKMFTKYIFKIKTEKAFCIKNYLGILKLSKHKNFNFLQCTLYRVMRQLAEIFCRPVKKGQK